MRILNSQNIDFQADLKQLLAVPESASVTATVENILNDIRQNGDKALLKYSAQLDKTVVGSVAELRILPERLKSAWDSLNPETQKALEIAKARIERYGEAQKMTDWSYTDEYGNVLGQKVTPLDSVGLYVPGGKASYPSSVLMNAVPAKVAGVKRLVMISPTPNGEDNPLVLGSAYLCGIDEVYRLGGAHGVGALAYGTETIAPVDKITGPGNQYVAEAKRLVFGTVGIDMIAGPSEVVVVADETVSPDWIIADLFAQAEHDETAQAILITTSKTVAENVLKRWPEMLAEQPRQAIIGQSIENRGAIIVAQDLNEALEIVNFIAPEHLELMIENPESALKNIRHAGAIFIGKRSNEVFGDYCAGANHVLPTARTARFASPLGVYDFQKRSSMVQLSEAGSEALVPVAQHLAQCEGLFAHALSAQLRGKQNDRN